MLISLNWLKDFVDISSEVSPKELGERLTVSTVEVEEVIDQAKLYEKMVVGEISKIQDHPDADKLKVCTTDVGLDHPVQIICGGQNIYEGMKVAVAMVGSKVRWHGQGNLVELKKAKIRGVESHGMICASAEIGLASSVEAQLEGQHGVMDLKIKDKAGTALAEALNLDDVIIEIDNKSLTNRPDLWGHQGMAREISAIFELPLKDSVLGVEAKGKSSLNISIKDTSLCHRFTVSLVEGVKVEPSPEWLQTRLRAVGLRPINNIVDITNFVMFDVGQPTHAFDAEKLGSHIEVRLAKSSEKLRTLDGEDRELTDSTLVVTNKDEVVSLAGIIGGESTQVTDKTKSVVFEAASWNPLNLRRTALSLGTRTDASMRFDKGIDPERAILGMQRILKLVSEIIPSATISTVEDSFPTPLDEINIGISHEFIEKRIGQIFKKTQVVNILERLGYGVSEDSGNYKIVVPSWRATGDVSLPEDIVEEVARIYGYNNLEDSVPLVELRVPNIQVEVELNWKAKKYLSSTVGMHEVYNYPWVEDRVKGVLDRFGMDKDTLRIAHPPSPSNSHIVQSPLHNLLLNTETNLRFRNEFGIFELTRIFKPELSGDEAGDDKLPLQQKRLVGLKVSKELGAQELHHGIRTIIDGLLQDLQVNYDLSFGADREYLQKESSISIKSGKQVLGEFGLLPKELLNKLKIDAQIGLFFLDFDVLTKISKNKVSYESFPEFPAITRDIAIVVDSTIKYSDLEQDIRKSSNLLEQVELFDIYEDEQIGEGKRSLAWHLSFRNSKKTLTSDVADEEIKKIINSLKLNFKAILRE